MLSLAGRHQEAIEAQKVANEVAPFERPWAMVTLLDEAREYDAAIEEARQRLQAEPEPEHLLPHGPSPIAAKAWTMNGQMHGKNACGFPAMRPQPLPSSEPIVWAAEKAALQWQLDQLERKARTTYVSPVDLALIHAQLGDCEQTLSLLEQGVREHSPLLLWIHLDPAYDFLNNDKRYRSIIQQLAITTAS